MISLYMHKIWGILACTLHFMLLKVELNTTIALLAPTCWPPVISTSNVGHFVALFVRPQSNQRHSLECSIIIVTVISFWFIPSYLVYYPQQRKGSLLSSLCLAKQVYIMNNRIHLELILEALLIIL